MATNIEQVQLLIGDTTATQFTTVQIQVFLDMASDSIFLAASYALEAWAASLTDGLTSEKIGDYAYTKKEADTKINLAKKYREEDANNPYLTWSEMDLTGIEDTTVSEDLE